MNAKELAERVGELYAAEVLGEALANRWLALTRDAEEQYKLQLFLQLESEAKVRLRPLLARHGVSLVESEQQKADGANAATQFAALPWREAMATLAKLALPYAQRFEELLAVAPTEDLPLVHFMVDHERFVSQVAEREARGEPAIATELVARLAHPIARGE